MDDCDTKTIDGAATLVRMGAKTMMTYEGTRYGLPMQTLIPARLIACLKRG